jgi:hypothetical protein
MRRWPRAMPGCSGCRPPPRPVSRAPSGPPTGWPPPAPRWSCTATTRTGLHRAGRRVTSEARRLRATQAELEGHARKRSLLPARRPGGPGPQPARPGHHRRPHPGRHHGQGQPLRHRGQVPGLHRPGPKTSETGQSDRKGQPITKAGNKLPRTTLVRAPDTPAAKTLSSPASLDPDGPARQRPPRRPRCGRRPPGRTRLNGDEPGHALCGLRHRRHPAHPAQAKAIIAEHWTLPEHVRRQRRSRKGKTLSTSSPAMHTTLEANQATLPLGHSWPPAQPRQPDPASTSTAKPP